MTDESVSRQPTTAPAPLSVKEIVTLGWRALRRLGVAEDAIPDAIQDALLVLHRRKEDFRGDSTFKTWVYGVLVRVASDYRKKAAHRARIFTPLTDNDLERATSETAFSPHQSLEQREAVRFLYRVLNRLPADNRGIFVLVELEELDLSTAAAALGLRESTAKGRLRAARRMVNVEFRREKARHERVRAVAS